MGGRATHLLIVTDDAAEAELYLEQLAGDWLSQHREHCGSDDWHDGLCLAGVRAHFLVWSSIINDDWRTGQMASPPPGRVAIEFLDEWVAAAPGIMTGQRQIDAAGLDRAIRAKLTQLLQGADGIVAPPEAAAEPSRTEARPGVRVTLVWSGLPGGSAVDPFQLLKRLAASQGGAGVPLVWCYGPRVSFGGDHLADIQGLPGAGIKTAPRRMALRLALQPMVTPGPLEAALFDDATYAYVARSPEFSTHLPDQAPAGTGTGRDLRTWVEAGWFQFVLTTDSLYVLVTTTSPFVLRREYLPAREFKHSGPEPTTRWQILAAVLGRNAPHWPALKDEAEKVTTRGVTDPKKIPPRLAAANTTIRDLCRDIAKDLDVMRRHHPNTPMLFTTARGRKSPAMEPIPRLLILTVPTPP